MLLRTALLTLTLLLPSAVLAQEKTLPEIITFDGYGFAWQDNWRDKDPSKRGKLVVYDVVSAWNTKRPALVADCEKHQTKLKGVTWCFANEGNLNKFKERTLDGNNDYIPFAGGRCAAGASWGLLVARGDPRTAKILKDPFGDRILVLQSNKKWWAGFTNEGLLRAMLAFNGAKGPRIVPN